MNKSTRILVAMVTTSVAMAGTAGCSLVQTAGIDYSSPATDQATAPAGAPEIVSMTVTKTWPMTGAGRVTGMDTLPDGHLLAIAAPDVTSGAPGELISVNTAAATDVDPSSTLYPIPFGSEYAAAHEASIQVAHGWSVAVGPTGSTAVSAGNRFGVVKDLGRSPDEPGNYFGVVTDQPGSLITPVSGACWFPGTGDDAAGTMTADGSNTLERRVAAATGPGDGRPSRVLMQAGPQLGVRPGQQAIAEQAGPGAPPSLAPAKDLVVGGLADLVCLDDQQVEQLHTAGVTDGLRSGRGASVVAVVDRTLADGWYTGGTEVVQNAAGNAQPTGTHSTGALVGAATPSGPNRLDAVAIDLGSGVAVAGFQLRGEGVADNAQITSLTLDKNDAGKGWVTVAGQDKLYEFVIGVR
ncbi:hypothetical protein ABIE52_006804 [Rhodococcus sp. OAS809]|uniref:hypothetical protein n=1 Tax=Rhodococcus sp. OAS809 TaxID=2663874 RepID=UPI00178B8A37